MPRDLPPAESAGHEEGRQSPRTWFQRGARVFGAVMVPLMRSRLGARFLSRGLARLRYVGRRSGTAVELVVAYRKHGEQYVVGVMAPDQKSWWRNFTGDGAPVTLEVGSTTICGHGVAVVDGDTRIVITPDRA